ANNGVHGFFLIAPERITTPRTYVAEGPVRWLAAGPLVVEARSEERRVVQLACTGAGTVAATANAADYEDGQTANCLKTTRCRLTIPAPPQGKVNKIDYVTCIIRTDPTDPIFFRADMLVQANNGVHGFFLLAHIADTLRTHVAAEGAVRWLAGGPLVVEV